MRLPNRVQRERKPSPERECPRHRAWVRRHHCCVPACLNIPIECAHVRTGTDSAVAKHLRLLRIPSAVTRRLKTKVEECVLKVTHTQKC
jgi:hypothetical protein